MHAEDEGHLMHLAFLKQASGAASPLLPHPARAAYCKLFSPKFCLLYPRIHLWLNHVTRLAQLVMLRTLIAVIKIPSYSRA